MRRASIRPKSGNSAGSLLEITLEGPVGTNFAAFYVFVSRTGAMLWPLSPVKSATVRVPGKPGPLPRIGGSSRNSCSRLTKINANASKVVFLSRSG
jgi:hypothetical protein